jgi:hypothetical protein
MTGRQLESHLAGNALLVSPAGHLDRQAAVFTAGLAADPEYHLMVVVDLPAGSELADWAPVADLLEPYQEDVRLVIGRPPRDGAQTVGRWLADRLDRIVLVADGPVFAAAGGALFIQATNGHGWMRCEPGAPARRYAQRFPRPAWEQLVPDRTWSVGTGTVAEPLPAGVWLRDAHQVDPADPVLDTHRQRLAHEVPCRVDRLVVVLGTPDGTPLPLDDIGGYWRSVPVDARTALRFAPYGPVDLAGGGSLGKALANLLGAPVMVLAGLGPDTGPEVTYEPTPVLTATPTPTPVLTVTPTPTVMPVPTPELGLEPGPEPEPEPGPEPESGLGLEPGLEPTAEAGPRVQPTPADSAVPPPWGIDEERMWLRRTFSREYEAEASSVARILSQSPGLRGDQTAPSDVIADLVAVRLYLSGRVGELSGRVAEPSGHMHMAELDSALRSGKGGAHVLLARCIATGLQRLPSFHGATILRVELTDAEWEWYQEGNVLTEWGFLGAYLSPQRLPGNVSFLIWSMGARRTTLLEPAIPSRVLFPPGTVFKVLSVRHGPRRAVLLRELSSSEAGSAGSAEAPLDTMALAGLERVAGDWLAGEAVDNRTSSVPGPVPGPGFGQAPGLVVAAARL